MAAFHSHGLCSKVIIPSHQLINLADKSDVLVLLALKGAVNVPGEKGVESGDCSAAVEDLSVVEPCNDVELGKNICDDCTQRNGDVGRSLVIGRDDLILPTLTLGDTCKGGIANLEGEAPRAHATSY